MSKKYQESFSLNLFDEYGQKTRAGPQGAKKNGFVFY
jgi:hypothetical protein